MILIMSHMRKSRDGRRGEGGGRGGGKHFIFIKFNNKITETRPGSFLLLKEKIIPRTHASKLHINKSGSLSITALLHNGMNKRNEGEIYPGINARGIQKGQVKSLSREPHNVLLK